MKIHLVQYIIILELVYREYKPLIYKKDMYKGKKKKRRVGSLKGSKLLRG